MSQDISVRGFRQAGERTIQVYSHRPHSMEETIRFIHEDSGVRVYIAREHPYVRAALRHLNVLFHRYPLPLTPTLRTIVFSAHANTSASAFAIMGDWRRIVYPYAVAGTIQTQRTQGIFDHEMGHLSGKFMTGGPRKPNRWRQARIDDGQYLQSLTRQQVQELRRRRYFHGYVANQIASSPDWVTQYAQDSAAKHGQVEDWADSWALYLMGLRRGHLLYHRHWHGRNQGAQLQFEDVFPHRAVILEKRFNKLRNQSVA